MVDKEIRDVIPMITTLPEKGLILINIHFYLMRSDSYLRPEWPKYYVNPDASNNFIVWVIGC